MTYMRVGWSGAETPALRVEDGYHPVLRATATDIDGLDRQRQGVARA